MSIPRIGRRLAGWTGVSSRDSKTVGRLVSVQIDGTDLQFSDHEGSEAVDIVARELNQDAYKLSDIAFGEDDIVIDIGGHVGVVATFLGKRFPLLRIYSFEPVPDNYQHLLSNIRRNKVQNVQAFNLAVTSDRRDFEMVVHFASNSGGATGHVEDLSMPGHSRFSTSSITLDDIFAMNRINRCRLLKIDCEGSEHEILLNSRSLDRVDYLVGEFHINDHLIAQGHSIEKLVAHCNQELGENRVFVSKIRMSE